MKSVHEKVRELSSYYAKKRYVPFSPKEIEVIGMRLAVSIYDDDKADIDAMFLMKQCNRFDDQGEAIFNAVASGVQYLKGRYHGTVKDKEASGRASV